MEKTAQLSREELFIENLPVGVRGWAFNLALYTGDTSKALRILQNYIDVPDTGEYDTETCEKLENMIEYKGINSVLHELANIPLQNGARYICSQFDTKIQFTDSKDKVTLFNKDNYGVMIDGRDK